MSAGGIECQSQQCPWRPQRPWTSPPPYKSKALWLLPAEVVSESGCSPRFKSNGSPHGVRLGKKRSRKKAPMPLPAGGISEVQWDPELSVPLSSNKEILTPWVWTKTNPRPRDHNLDPHFYQSVMMWLIFPCESGLRSNRRFIKAPESQNVILKTSRFLLKITHH